VDLDALNGFQETVAAAGESFDVGRMIGRIGEGLAEFVDGFVEAVFEVDESLGGPEALLYFVAGDDGTRMLEKHDEDFERLAGKTELDAMLAKLASGDIHFERVEAEEECGFGLDGDDPSAVLIKIGGIVARGEA